MTPPAERPTVLVVDDEPLNRDLLRRVLYREYKILEAGDADAALQLIDEGAIDVMLCDQVMPGRTGTDLAREVRRRSPATVALLLTGYEDAPDVMAALGEGVIAEVVGKPWVPAHLKEVLEKALARAKASR